MKCDIRDNMPQGKLSFVIFFEKCNFRCKYCNLDWLQSLPEFTYERLEESLPFIDTICFSGGEPTLTPTELMQIVQRIKKYGKELILYSNGYDKERLYSIKENFKTIYIDCKSNTNKGAMEYTLTQYNHLIDNYIAYDNDIDEKFIIRCHEDITLNFKHKEKYILQK